MFTQIWNTSIGWGYVYQWWLSALMYYLLIKKKSIRIKGEADFNKKINGLLKHFWWSLGPYRIEHKNLYLEWNDESLEDINFLKKTTSGVWYGFIQSKTKQEQDSVYTNISQIKHTITRFYNNEHFKDGMKCSFVIASNVKINESYKKKIKNESIDFKIDILPELLWGKIICDEINLPKLLSAIEENNIENIERVISTEITIEEFLDSYEKLSVIIRNIYFFDDISPKNIITSIESIKKKIKKEEILFHTIYKATRRKVLEPSDDDYDIYGQFPDTKFWWNPKTDIINWGFLLLGN